MAFALEDNVAMIMKALYTKNSTERIELECSLIHTWKVNRWGDGLWTPCGESFPNGRIYQIYQIFHNFLSCTSVTLKKREKENDYKVAGTKLGSYIPGPLPRFGGILYYEASQSISLVSYMENQPLAKV